MEAGDTEKYQASSLIQGFVFSSRKMGCIRSISSQVYNKIIYKHITGSENKPHYLYESSPVAYV